MRGLDRIKITYNPVENKHYIHGWNAYFYDSNSDLVYEDWECLFPIEDCTDWEEILIKMIKGHIEEDNN